MDVYVISKTAQLISMKFDTDKTYSERTQVTYAVLFLLRNFTIFWTKASLYSATVIWTLDREK